MIRQRLAFQVAAGWLVLASLQGMGPVAVSGEVPDPASLNALNEVICGPRCVHFVLKHYGIEESLAGVVRQMQWPDLAKGSTVIQIENALGSRGIFTRTIELSQGAAFRPESPAIVHLGKDPDREDSPEPHFVVVMPESTWREAVLWDGLFGIHREPWNDFSKKMTGVVVLTGHAPIETLEEVVRIQGSAFAWKWWLGGALALLAGLVLLIPLGPRAVRGLTRRTNLK